MSWLQESAVSGPPTMVKRGPDKNTDARQSFLYSQNYPSFAATLTAIGLC